MKLVREMMIADVGVYEFEDDNGNDVRYPWVDLLDTEGGVFRATVATKVEQPAVMTKARFAIEIRADGTKIKARFLGPADANGAQAKPDPKPAA